MRSVSIFMTTIWVCTVTAGAVLAQTVENSGSAGATSTPVVTAPPSVGNGIANGVVKPSGAPSVGNGVANGVVKSSGSPSVGNGVGNGVVKSSTVNQ